MFDEFKKFIFKGDVVALATGVIIGAAFKTIIDALTKGVINPTLQLFGGSPEVTLGFVIGEGTDNPVHYDLGLIISSVISFLITAAVIFFFIVKPAKAMMQRLLTEEKKSPPAPAADVVLLGEIRDLLAKKNS